MAANYAPFTNAIFAETLFGAPPSVNVYTKLTITPYQFDTLTVNWQPQNTSTWAEQVLVRSSYGIPTSIFDGTIVLDEKNIGAYSGSFTDSGLQPGHFYYYALFVNFIEQATPLIEEFVLAGSAQGLVITDWGFETVYQNWTPDWYLELDSQLATTAQPEGPLVRFLNMLGYEMDWMRSEIESLFTLTNVDQISGALLPYLGFNLGVVFEPELGMTRTRVLVKNAVFLYKNRGTAIGIEAAASAFSGFSAEVTAGKNLEIQLDDSAFDRSAGHWLPVTPTSTITPVATSLYNVSSAPHTSYDPVVQLGDEVPTAGYLPVNNINVALISAGTGVSVSQSWLEISPSVSPPARTQSAFVYDPTTALGYLFGGFLNSSTPAYDLWSWNGSMWANITPSTTTPTPQLYAYSGAYDTHTGNFYLFGGINPTSGVTVNGTYTYSTPSTTWFQNSPSTSPPARSWATSVYHPPSQTVVLFGGTIGTGQANHGELNDLWTYDGTNWTQITPLIPSGSLPPPRFYHSMCYDSANQTIYIFGGEFWYGSAGPNYLNDIWALTYSAGTWTWTNVTPASGSAPSGRESAGMVYMAHAGVVVVFGGLNGSGSLNDTWAFTGTAWSQNLPTNVPLGRQSPVFFHDSNSNVSIMFGGINTSGGGGVLSDTWKLTGTTSTNLQWTLQSPATVPPGRYYAVGDFYTGTNTGFMAGGIGGVSGILQDTWTWSTGGNNWTQINFTSSPPARWGHAMAYYPTTTNVVLFGGSGDTSNLGDTWVWNGTAWTQKAPASSPSARTNSAMAYDTASSQFVLFGGLDSNVGAKNDTWVWNGTTWTVQSPGTSPPAREGHILFYDSVQGGLILFGGFNISGTPINDTWLWKTGNWSQLSPVTVPAARGEASTTLDSTLGANIMYGGEDVHGNSLGDLWKWTGNNWQQITLGPLNPGNLTGGAMAYIPANSGDVLFGGNDFQGAFTEQSTWLFSSSSTSFPQQFEVSTCTVDTAPTLGLPITQQATPQSIVLSAYFQPVPSATPVIRSFQMRLDWYDLHGVLLSSSTGAAVAETLGQWNRAYVVASPPAGAIYFGRTVLSVGTLSGDQHLMDAELVEINTQATPGPSSWAPPRDITINLFPVRQNLVVNPVGLAGTSFGWTTTHGTATPSQSQAINWPTDTIAGFILQANSTSNLTFSQTIVVNPQIPYTFSAYMEAATTPRTIQLTLQFNNGMPVSTTFTDATGSFTRGSIQNTIAPAGASSATLTITIESPVNTEQHRLSGVMFEPSSTLNPYFDATYEPATDYLFEGTPNESVSDYYPQLAAKLARLASVLPDYVPIGSTFSLVAGAQAWANVNLHG